VYGTDKHNSIIREKCMDYIQKNSVFYSQYIEGGEKQMSAYIERKRKGGIWADNLEIEALAEIYQRTIEIYINPENPILIGQDKKRFPIKISYHGNKHYNSIVPSMTSDNFIKYKRELLSTSPGAYETDFIKNYDISKKFKQKIANFNEPIDYGIQNYDFDEEEFLYQEAIKDSQRTFTDEQNKNLNKINDENESKNNVKYLSDPIIQNALEFGFNLNDAIEALEICGHNEELVMDYLCNNQK
jgi:hypothetical protein